VSDLAESSQPEEEEKEYLTNLLIGIWIEWDFLI